MRLFSYLLMLGLALAMLLPVANASTLQLPNTPGTYRVTMLVNVDPDIAEDNLALCTLDKHHIMALHFSRGLNGHTNPRFGLAEVDYTMHPMGLTIIVTPINYTLLHPNLKWKLVFTATVENNTLYVNGYKACTGTWNTNLSAPWILSGTVQQITEPDNTKTPVPEHGYRQNLWPLLGVGVMLGIALLLVRRG